MKRLIKIALSVALCVAMVFAFTACSMAGSIKPKDFFKTEGQHAPDSQYVSSKVISKDTIFDAGEYYAKSPTFDEDGMVFYRRYWPDGVGATYGARSLSTGKNSGLRFEKINEDSSGYGMFLASYRYTSATEYGVFGANNKNEKLVAAKSNSVVKFYNKEYFSLDGVLYKVSDDRAVAIMGNAAVGGQFSEAYDTYDFYKDCIIATKGVTKKAAFDKDGKKLGEVVLDLSEDFVYIGDGNAFIQKTAELPSDAKDYTYYTSGKKVKVTNRVYNFKKGTDKEIKTKDFLISPAGMENFASMFENKEFADMVAKKYENSVIVPGFEIADKQLTGDIKVKMYNSSMKLLGNCDSQVFFAKIAKDAFVAMNASTQYLNLLDGKGNVLFSLDQTQQPEIISNGLRFEVEGKLGSVGADGKIITPFEYTNASAWGNHAIGGKDGKLYSIDLTNNSANEISQYSGIISAMNGVYTTTNGAYYNFAGAVLYVPTNDNEKVVGVIGECENFGFAVLANGNIVSFSK